MQLMKLTSLLLGAVALVGLALSLTWAGVEADRCPAE